MKKGSVKPMPDENELRAFFVNGVWGQFTLKELSAKTRVPLSSLSRFFNGGHLDLQNYFHLVRYRAEYRKGNR